MKLDQIGKVKQVYSDAKANELMDKGYKIIKIFSSKIMCSGISEVKPVYVLGIKVRRKKK